MQDWKQRGSLTRFRGNQRRKLTTPWCVSRAGLSPEGPGLLSIATAAEVRRRHLVDGEKISALARELDLSRDSVEKSLNQSDVPLYHRRVQPKPTLGPTRSGASAAPACKRSFCWCSHRARRHSATGAMSGSSAAGWCRASSWRTFASPTAVRASSGPTRGRRRRDGLRRP